MEPWIDPVEKIGEAWEYLDTIASKISLIIEIVALFFCKFYDLMDVLFLLEFIPIVFPRLILMIVL